MAGDWIKIELTTPDKPEVVAMAAALRIDQDAVVGKLFRIWAWADQNSVDGVAMPVSDAFLDRLANKKSFASAMRKVGWLSGADGSLCFTSFDRHNGSSAKARAMDNRKKASQRARDKEGDRCPVVVPMPTGQHAGQTPGPEKRREEKIQSPPSPQGGGGGRFEIILPPEPLVARHAYPEALRNSEAFVKCWEAEWIPYLCEKNGGRLPAIMTTETHLKTCLRLGPTRAISGIRSAIGKGWKQPDEDAKVNGGGNMLTERPWDDEPEGWRNYWRTKYPPEDYPDAPRHDENEWKTVRVDHRKLIWEGMQQVAKASRRTG